VHHAPTGPRHWLAVLVRRSGSRARYGQPMPVWQAAPVTGEPPSIFSFPHHVAPWQVASIGYRHVPNFACVLPLPLHFTCCVRVGHLPRLHGDPRRARRPSVRIHSKEPFSSPPTLLFRGGRGEADEPS